MQNELVLSVSHLFKQFPVKNKTLYAVSDVNFELRRGETIGIVGESGCGKSTVARMIAGSLEPTSGEILVKGTDFYKLKGKQRRLFRRNIQMVFQDPLSSFSPRMHLGPYLCEPRVNYDKIDKKTALEEAKAMLEKVGLPGDFVDRYPHELSGGQLQRVAIARAMLIDPPILICDEATSALDVTIQDQIAQLLVKIVDSKDMGCIFIGHDLALVRSITQRIIVMYLGRVVETLDSEDLESKCLHPYTKSLLGAIFDVYCDKDKEIQTLNGETPSALEEQKGCPFAQRCPYSIQKCFDELPKLKEVDVNHTVACHLI